VASTPDAVPGTSRALWSTDLVDWTEIADRGAGYAFPAEDSGGAVIVELRVDETEVLENGSVRTVGDATIRQVRLEPID